jgi:DNA-binding response OmpR family regulator
MPSDTITQSGIPELNGFRVLVVEDGWQVANALKLSLERMGVIVVGPAATTEEARRLVVRRDPDLAIVDVNLKGELAYDFMDWLYNRKVPVVVMSGYKDLPSSLDKFAATLRKPFTFTSLSATLQRVLGRKSSA